MAYLAVFSAQLRMGLQYRAAALSGLVAQLVFGLISLHRQLTHDFLH